MRVLVRVRMRVRVCVRVRVRVRVRVLMCVVCMYWFDKAVDKVTCTIGIPCTIISRGVHADLRARSCVEAGTEPLMHASCGRWRGIARQRVRASSCSLNTSAWTLESAVAAWLCARMSCQRSQKVSGSTRARTGL